MTPIQEEEAQTVAKPFKRTGLEKEVIQLPDDFDENFNKSDTLQPAENTPPHNDPFDRMLIAQAKYEKKSPGNRSAHSAAQIVHAPCRLSGMCASCTCALFSWTFVSGNGMGTSLKI